MSWCDWEDLPETHSEIDALDNKISLALNGFFSKKIIVYKKDGKLRKTR